MLTEEQFERHLEGLTREELIDLCLYWRKKGNEYYWELLRIKEGNSK